MTVDRVEPIRQETVRRGVIIAFLVGGAILVGLSIFAQADRKKPAARIPTLTLLTTDTTLSAGEAVIRFVTDADLMLHKDGWMAGSLHPHLRMDDLVAMAGPADIVHVAADTFAWKLATPAQGEHELELFWADMAHSPSGKGAHGRVVIKP